jgi:hypothetical protein
MIVKSKELVNMPDCEDMPLWSVDRQEELLKANSIEYKIALEKGDLYAVGAIGNALQQQARDIIFDVMIYV